MCGEDKPAHSQTPTKVPSFSNTGAPKPEERLRIGCHRQRKTQVSLHVLGMYVACCPQASQPEVSKDLQTW